jgi:hypothetical protein
VQSGGSFFPHVFKKYFQDFNAKTHSQILKNPCISEPKTRRIRPATQARDRALAGGIVINGLPIINDRPQVYGYPPFPDLDNGACR